MNVNGIEYILENTAFPNRFITHEMIIEMFYRNRNVDITAINEIGVDFKPTFYKPHIGNFAGDL